MRYQSGSSLIVLTLVDTRASKKYEEKSRRTNLEDIRVRHAVKERALYLVLKRMRLGHGFSSMYSLVQHVEAFLFRRQAKEHEETNFACVKSTYTSNNYARAIQLVIKGLSRILRAIKPLAQLNEEPTMIVKEMIDSAVTEYKIELLALCSDVMEDALDGDLPTFWCLGIHLAPKTHSPASTF